MENYDMSFSDVVNEIFDTNGWYQGSDFSNGTFIKVNSNTATIGIYGFSENHFGETYVGDFYISRGIKNMHYRRVHSQPEIMRKQAY